MKTDLFLDRFRSFLRTDFIKSIYINLRLLPFYQAIRMPIVVTYATTIGLLSGKIILKTKCKTGLLRFGYLHSDLISWKKHHSFLSIQGVLTLNGWSQFGVGYSLNIDKDAELHLGNNCSFGANGIIVNRDYINIQDNFRAAWEVQILDTNFHYIKNTITQELSQKSKPINVGKNNWIGNRSTIMQGTNTPDFFIVTSNSVCNKDYKSTIPECSLVGGTPAKLIKSNVVRVLDAEERQIDELLLRKKSL